MGIKPISAKCTKRKPKPPKLVTCYRCQCRYPNDGTSCPECGNGPPVYALNWTQYWDDGSRTPMMIMADNQITMRYAWSVLCCNRVMAQDVKVTFNGKEFDPIKRWK